MCRKPAAPLAENPFTPFCGARCRDLDLAAWLDERYAIPTDEPVLDADADATPHPAGDDA